MTLRIRVLMAIATLTLTAALEQPQAQTARQALSAAQRIVGAWQLVTRTVRKADGTILADPVLGAQPLGRLYYDASGVMMLQMMRLGRTAAIGTPANPKDAANARVVLGYDAYFGKYTIDERAGTITHRVEGSLFPEDLGKDFVRLFTLEGDTLTLKFTSTADGSDVTRTLVFQRSK
jgi:Lipocalin-like domain